MQALLQILLFPSLRTSNSCNASNFSTSIISLLNKARTFSFASLSRFSILVILLKLKSNHSKLINRSRPFIRNHQMVCIIKMGTTFAVEPTDEDKSVFRKIIKIKSKIIGTTWWFLEPVILSIKLLSRNNLVRLCNRVKLSIFTIFMNSNLQIMFRNYRMFNEMNILLLSVYSSACRMKMESQKSSKDDLTCTI